MHEEGSTVVIKYTLPWLKERNKSQEPEGRVIPIKLPTYSLDNVMRAWGEWGGCQGMSILQTDVSGEWALVITLPETPSLAVQRLLYLGSPMFTIELRYSKRGECIQIQIILLNLLDFGLCMSTMQQVVFVFHNSFSDIKHGHLCRLAGSMAPEAGQAVNSQVGRERQTRHSPSLYGTALEEYLEPSGDAKCSRTGSYFLIEDISPLVRELHRLSVCFQGPIQGPIFDL